MNDVIPFTHETFGTVRSMLVDGEPWFIGKDVADILGYTNNRKALADHVDDEDKDVTKCYTLGGNQKTTIINESGLYSLIISSKLQQAKAFKRWITHDVIPSIRKHGMYATTETINAIIDNPDFGIQLLQQLKEEREKNSVLQSTVEQQAKKIEEDAPKVTYYDLVLQSPDLLATKDIAGDYGMTAQTMNKLLHEFGVQYKAGRMWHLYAKYNGKGYAKTTTETFHNHTRLWLKWSQQGRLFIYDLMKEHGYLPSCEQITA